MSSRRSSDSAEEATALQGWKEIAAHLGITLRTAQAWEKDRGLPVRRVPGKRSVVYCLPSELDDWRATGGLLNASEGRTSSRTRQLVVLSLAAVLVAALAVVWRSEPTLRDARLLESRPLTSSRDIEGRADISPQADRVAYLARDSSDTSIVRVLAIEDGSVEDRASDALHGSAVRWSPSGSSLAYVRRQEDLLEIVEIDRSGTTRALVALEGRDQATKLIDNTTFDWGSAGLAVSGRDESGTFYIELVSPETGAAVRVTTPPANHAGDTMPAFSPDGSAVAFARFSSLSESELYVTDLQTGEERQLTDANRRIWGLDWESDGSIIYASKHSLGGTRLYRTDLDGNSSTPLTGAESTSQFPNIGRDRSGNTVLVYQKKETWSRIWHSEPGFEPSVAVESTWIDAWPSLSPDGDRLAFTSQRSGASEVWVGPVDGGEDPIRLTHRDGPYTRMPRWSPDGTKVTFSSADADGRRSIYLVDVASRVTTRLTTAASEEGRASWSRDGRWIYFSSDRTGRPEIWKRTADGQGIASQVTFQGGYEAFEIDVGGALYYIRDRRETELWSVPVDGGEERFVLAGPREGRWQVVAHGVVFQQGRQFLRWRSRPDTVATVYETETGKQASLGFTFAPNLKSVWWVQTDRRTSDLWIADL